MTGGNSVTLKQVSEVRSIGSARKDLQLCRLGVHMHGPSLSGMSGTAVGGPGSPHSDSVFRSNTSTDLTNRDQPVGWRRGVVHLHSPYRRDPATQVPPLGVGDPLPQVSRDTCSGTASIRPLRGYTRHWDGKRGDDAAFRSDISAWMCHNRLANLVACLLDAVQVARSIGIRAPFERARSTPNKVRRRDGSASPAYDHKQHRDV